MITISEMSTGNTNNKLKHCLAALCTSLSTYIFIAVIFQRGIFTPLIANSVAPLPVSKHRVIVQDVHDVKSRELNCSVRLAAPGTFPMVALASPPGAGNTWTRHLIQQATGFYTGSQYRYQVLADTGYGGEMENITSGTTLTFKTHWVDFDRPGLTGVERQVRAVILLLRNPCNLAISERNRRETINQTGMVAWNSSLRNDREWFSVLEWQVHLYERFVNNWIGTGKPILVVHYENIKEDAVRELRRVVKFLNLTVDNERLECVRGNIEGNYHRKYSDKSQLYRDVLPPPIKRYAQMVMERVSDFLVEHGQDPVPWQNIPTGILPNT